MDDLMEKFPDTIQNYDYYHFVEIHKWRYLPDKQY